jgi:single-strand DNA-binding protein
MTKVILSGRTVAEPSLRFTPSGKATASFTLAVKRSFKNAQGEYESDFINCVAWGKQAEIIAEYVKKGQIIPISGRLQVRTYEKDSQKHWVSEVIVEEFDFPEKRSNSENPNNSYGTEVSDQSDIPF